MLTRFTTGLAFFLRRLLKRTPVQLPGETGEKRKKDGSPDSGPAAKAPLSQKTPAASPVTRKVVGSGYKELISRKRSTGKLGFCAWQGHPGQPRGDWTICTKIVRARARPVPDRSLPQTISAEALRFGKKRPRPGWGEGFFLFVIFWPMARPRATGKKNRRSRKNKRATLDGPRGPGCHRADSITERGVVWWLLNSGPPGAASMRHARDQDRRLRNQNIESGSFQLVAKKTVADALGG